MADYYELLEVSRDATPDDIKRAYRRLARQLHPDTNPDPDDAERFKQVAHAYEVLSDPEKRRRYDRFGPDGVNAGAGAGAGFGGGGLNDIFDAFFGGGSPFGGGGAARAARRVAPTSRSSPTCASRTPCSASASPSRCAPRSPCETCEASGASRGTEPMTCLECAGAGQVQRVRQSFLGQMVTNSVCPRCGGQGRIVSDPCADCRGEGRRVEERTYTVDIPAGVDTGSTLRLTGRGAAGPRGGGTGDLYVHVRVAAARALHPRRRRPALRSPHLVHAGRARGPPRVRHARRHGGPRHPARHARRDGSSACGAAACRTSSAAAGAT